MYYIACLYMTFMSYYPARTHVVGCTEKVLALNCNCTRTYRNRCILFSYNIYTIEQMSVYKYMSVCVSM